MHTFGNAARLRNMAAGMPRRGYTLIELLVAAAASTFLLAGLAGALFISTNLLSPDSATSNDANASALILGQIGSDLRNALRFHERTSAAVTFDVPDRTGDSIPETLRYAWSEVVDDPLLYQFNGGTAVSVATKVKQFAVTGLTRSVPSEALDIPITSSVSYDGFSEGKSATDLQFVMIPAPAGSATGKLLIALVAVDRDEGNFLMAQGGWHRLARLNRSDEVGVGVWWKIAGANEPAWYVFYWPGLEQAYGCIMRFSGVHPTRPINAFATGVGTSAAPICPAVTSTVTNTLILRLGGFDGDRVAIDNAGVVGHTTITADRSSNSGGGSSSAAAAYTTMALAGSAPATTFLLTGIEEYATMTVAIAPNTGN